ncbi:hypothetical protein P2318_04130 [Myxococcaceae bacterium GXIMD 01537]
MNMKTTSLLASTLLCSSLLSGCSFFGYHKVPKAVRAPPEEAAAVRFPDAFDKGLPLDGPTLVALTVALNEFMPPEARAQDRDEKLARCLSRRDTYDVAILKENDDLYFISFTANLGRCGIQDDGTALDLGAVYAIDGKGRVLSVL